jgi:hypothetical protein
VIRKDFKLPTFDDLESGDVTYACYTNAKRNLICENIFASILEKRHPKAEENFDIPQGILIISRNLRVTKKSLNPFIRSFTQSMEMMMFNTGMGRISNVSIHA